MARAEAAGLELASMAHLYRSTFATTSDDEAVLARRTLAPFTSTDPHPDPSYITNMSAAVALG